MIRYELKCNQDHSFDSWFSSNGDYETLKKNGMIACSICGSTQVEKAIMAPRVSTSDERPLSGPVSPAEQMVKELRKKIESTADDVGTNFATEARKMHDGETPERAIYGETKPEEAKALIEDGVPVVPLPWTNRKTN